MLTVPLILAFWLAAGVAVCAAFSWLKRDDRRREQALACARNRHRVATLPGKLVCDCGAVSRGYLPFLDGPEPGQWEAEMLAEDEA